MISLSHPPDRDKLGQRRVGPEFLLWEFETEIKWGVGVTEQ